MGRELRGWAIGLLAALLSATPAHADDWIYVQRQNGIRHFTDQKPASGAYKRIPKDGRAPASASCLGLTPAKMQARAAFYEPTIRQVSTKHGLAPELVSAVMRVESCYDHRAVSRSGARGLMQLMPTTALQLGVTNSFDPEQNIDGGVRYLAAMLARFNNDLRLGLAAYNAGPEAVAEYQGIPPYPETINYVSRILKLYRPGHASAQPAGQRLAK